MSVLGSTHAGRWIDLLVGALEGTSLCPVIGAGATCDLPFALGLGPSSRLKELTWSGLVESLAAEHGFSAGDSGSRLPPGMDLQIAVDLIQDQVDFEGLRRSLDEKIPPDWAHRPEFKSSALYWLAQLAILVALRGVNRQFHAISFNFDCFLEEAIACLGYSAVAITESGEERWAPRNAREAFSRRRRRGVEVRVAHPHGLLTRPRDSFGIDRRERSFDADNLIFSASSYDVKSLQPVAKTSLWQIVTFGTSSCFFYGFSFQDPAVRALLRLANNMRGEARRELRHVALVHHAEAAGVRVSRQWEQRWVRELAKVGVARLGTRDDGFRDQKRFLQILVRAAQRRVERTEQ